MRLTLLCLLACAPPPAVKDANPDTDTDIVIPDPDTADPCPSDGQEYLLQKVSCVLVTEKTEDGLDLLLFDLCGSLTVLTRGKAPFFAAGDWVETEGIECITVTDAGVEAFTGCGCLRLLVCMPSLDPLDQCFLAAGLQ